jgi:hypothetical protein
VGRLGAAGGRGVSGDVDRRVRPPWRPERGQYIRFPGTTLAVPEWIGFAVAMAVCVALLAVAVLVF